MIDIQGFAGLGKKERSLLSILSSNDITLVTSLDVISILNCNRAYANTMLSRLAAKGWLQRVGPGKYLMVPISSLTPDPAIEDTWSLAMKLYEPAFLSGWTAAEHWDLTEQMFNSLSIISIKKVRNTDQLIGGLKFKIRVIDKNRFFGFKSIWNGSKKIEIADPSRLIIDIMDSPAFGGGGRHCIDVFSNYWRSELYDADLLLQYAERYNKGVIFKRIGFLAEKLKAPVSENWVNRCLAKISQGVSMLDPDGSQNGKINSKWRLKINHRIELR
jgi:predicted transcriptional regulator of viral defense system